MIGQILGRLTVSSSEVEDRSSSLTGLDWARLGRSSREQSETGSSKGLQRGIMQRDNIPELLLDNF